MSTGHDGVPRADDVGVDGVAEGLGGDLIPGRGIADARVGDNHVEAVEFADPAVDGDVERVQVTHVDRCGHDPPAIGTDQPGGLGEVVGCR